MNKNILLLSSLIIFSTISCRMSISFVRTDELSSKQKLLWDKAENLYKEKYDEKKLDQALEIYEEIIKSNPGYYPALVRASELYHAKAFVFLRNSDKKTRIELFARGKELGFQALNLNKQFFRTVKKKSVREAVKYIKKDQVAALFWAGVNWARWGELKGLVKVAMDLPNLKAMMYHVIELDEKFYYGGAHSFFGVLYSYLPQIAGKDLKRAKKHFAMCEKIAPDFLMTYAVEAEYYAYYSQNAGLFKDLIEKIINHKVEQKNNPHLLEDNFAKILAHELLEKYKDKFNEPL